MTHMVLSTYPVHADNKLQVAFMLQGFFPGLRNKQDIYLEYFTYRDSGENSVDGTNSNGRINRLADSSCLENAG